MAKHRSEHWYRVEAILDPGTDEEATVHMTVEAGNEEYAAEEVRKTYDGSGLRKASEIKIISVEPD